MSEDKPQIDSLKEGARERSGSQAVLPCAPGERGAYFCNAGEDSITGKAFIGGAVFLIATFAVFYVILDALYEYLA